MDDIMVVFKTLEEMSSLELHHLYKLRTDIFVVEQKCAYPEVDDCDLAAFHTLLFSDGELLACARLLPPGQNYPQPSIGRVAVREDVRGRGYAREVFRQTLHLAAELHPRKEIKVQAQTYLEPFYQAFGFKTISDPYPDFGVMHVDMILPA